MAQRAFIGCIGAATMSVPGAYADRVQITSLIDEGVTLIISSGELPEFTFGGGTLPTPPCLNCIRH